MIEQHLQAFVKWLEKRGYAPASVEKLSLDVRTYELHGEPPEAQKRVTRLRDYRWAWDLWSEFSEETGAPKMKRGRPTIPEVKGSRRRRLEPTRVLVAESIEEVDWQAFRAAVKALPGLPARVLEVQAATGKRMSDILRLTRKQLDGAFTREDGKMQIVVKGSKPVLVSVRGGAEEAWGHLRDALPREAKHVADAISPGSPAMARSAAGKQIERTIKKLCAGIEGWKGRAHSHRLRRTIIVRLLKAGVTLEMTAKVADQERIETTKRYADEAMVAEVGELLKKV